jgi:hypothetical protein
MNLLEYKYTVSLLIPTCSPAHRLASTAQQARSCLLCPVATCLCRCPLCCVHQRPASCHQARLLGCGTCAHTARAQLGRDQPHQQQQQQEQKEAVAAAATCSNATVSNNSNTGAGSVVLLLLLLPGSGRSHQYSPRGAKHGSWGFHRGFQHSKQVKLGLVALQSVMTLSSLVP